MSNLSKRARGAVEEVGGKIKKNFGRLIGDRSIELHGKADEIEGAKRQENAKAVERARGKAEELVGAVEKRVGAAVGSKRIEGEGKAREVLGKMRREANPEKPLPDDEDTIPGLRH